MRILVCVKRVPLTGGRIVLTTPYPFSLLYFLVILAATALAVIGLNWLQSGSGGGLLGGLFGKVISWVVGKF